MATIMVPKSRAETPTGGGSREFPEGDWQGIIEEVRVRDFPEFIGRDIAEGKTRGYASGSGEILSIQLGSNKSLDGDADVGAQKHFVDFVIRDGDVEVSAGPGIPEASWQMQRSAALLTNLALALGATEEVTDEKGDVFVATAENFLEQLRNEELNGSRVGFGIFHRKWTSKDGAKSGTEVQTREFFTAV